jgi:hypothetical protein
MARTTGMGLAEAIAELRAELTSASEGAPGGAMTFPIHAVTVELKIVVTDEADGRIGITVPFFGEVGGGMAASNEFTHTLTLELGPPEHSDGRAVRVTRASAEPLD